MKYKLININSPCSKNEIKRQGESCTLNNNCIFPNCKEEHICSRVTIDNFHYYIDDEIKGNSGLNYNYALQKLDDLSYSYESYSSEWQFCRKVIATNNFTLVDIPKVIDEVEKLAWDTILNNSSCNDDKLKVTAFTGYCEGYCKSKETYQFTEEDMIEFSWFLIKNLGKFSDDKSAHFKRKYLEMWKEEKLTTIYYE